MMHCSKKNSYLQLVHANIEPEVLNRCVDKARRLKELDPHDSSPPLQRLASHQPSLVVERIDFTRTRCGFGRLGLRQLRDDLLSYDIDVVLKSVTTIGDIVLNPELTYDLTNLRVHEILAHLIDKNDHFLTERVCDTYAKLALNSNGKMVIAKNVHILDRLKTLLLGEVNMRVLVKLGRCLENISSFVTTADVLVDNGFVQAILEILTKQDDEVVVVLLSTLKNLMYGNGNYIAMENGAFFIMISLCERLDHRVNIGALNCLMVMSSTPLGKQIAYDNDLLQTLTNLICLSENPELDCALTSVLMFCTVRSDAKSKAGKSRRLLARLIKISRNHKQGTVQMFAFMTLRNLVSLAEAREIISKKYMHLIKKTQCANSMVCEIRKKLMDEIDYPY